MVYFCRILMFLYWFSFLLFCFQWCHPSTHSGLVTHICIKEVQGNKFESKYDINIFFQRKCNWKCCPRYAGHFVQSSVGVFSFGISPMVLINWLTAVLVTMVTWWSSGLSSATHSSNDFWLLWIGSFKTWLIFRPKIIIQGFFNCPSTAKVWGFYYELKFWSTFCLHHCNAVGNIMMTSSNGNIVRVTGHLRGEFTGPRWIPHTKASDAELWCLLWSVPG